jgi:hypothetical protein
LRTIKFRVWDTELKEFSTDWTNRDPFLCLTTGDLFFYERANIFNQTGPDIICQDHGSRFIMQQYTGINDLHGNEIYEGDFIKSKIFAGDDDEQSITGKVVFIKGAFGVECYENEVPVEFIYLCHFEYLQIINERITNER